MTAQPPVLRLGRPTPPVVLGSVAPPPSPPVPSFAEVKRARDRVAEIASRSARADAYLRKLIRAAPPFHAPAEERAAARRAEDDARTVAFAARRELREARRDLERMELAREAATCGARCRDGHACNAPGNGRGGRCKLHGGKSTGPRRTAERAGERALGNDPIPDARG